MGHLKKKLNTNHPWVTGVQVSSKKGPYSHPKGDGDEKAKIH